MLILDVEISTERAQAYFDYAGFHVRSMTSPFRMIANLVNWHVQEQFDTEGYHLSGGWPELHPSTKRSRGDDGHPILVREGVLERNVTARPARGAEFGGGLRYGNGWLTFRPDGGHQDVDLVEVHSEGRGATGTNRDGVPTGEMPPRPIWETPADFDDELNAILSEWLDDLKRFNARRAGLDLPRPGELTGGDYFSWELA
jgi:hypothetical protein